MTECKVLDLINALENHGFINSDIHDIVQAIKENLTPEGLEEIKSFSFGFNGDHSYSKEIDSILKALVFHQLSVKS